LEPAPGREQELQLCWEIPLDMPDGWCGHLEYVVEAKCWWLGDRSDRTTAFAENPAGVDDLLDLGGNSSGDDGQGADRKSVGNTRRSSDGIDGNSSEGSSDLIEGRIQLP
jgi:hypothetical protein